MKHANPKIQALLELGPPDNRRQWPDYVNRYGLTADDLPDLLALVRDPSIDDIDSDRAEVWGPLHAWRALGQIGSEAEVEALVSEFDRLHEDDHGLAELPAVIGMIGPAAIPALEAYWQQSGRDEFAYVMAMDALCEIAKRHPSSRDRVLGIYRNYMQAPDRAMDSLNGLLMAALLDLGAVEAIDDIRRLFSLGCVDPGCAGDLEDIEIELGLRDKRSTPRSSPVQLQGLQEAAVEEIFDDDEDTLSDLHDLIEHYLHTHGSGEAILNVSELDGYFAALACSPQLVRPSTWMPGIWGSGDAQPVWESLAEGNQFTSAIMVLYNQVMQEFRAGEFEPLFLYDEDSDGLLPSVADWCEGFMRGFELWDEIPPHQWHGLEDDLTPIAFFASADNLEDIRMLDDSQIEALQLSIQPQVMKIYRRFRRGFSLAPAATYVREAPKVGRNAPCPCGSGKKYKKCCGAA